MAERMDTSGSERTHTNGHINPPANHARRYGSRSLFRWRRSRREPSRPDLRKLLSGTVLALLCGVWAFFVVTVPRPEGTPAVWRDYPEFRRPESVTFGVPGAKAISVPQEVSDLSATLAAISDEVVASVVSVVPAKVDTVIVLTSPFGNGAEEGDSGDASGLFEQLFGKGKGRLVLRKTVRRMRGVGSGVVVSKQGYIVTSSHVVRDADEVTVHLHDQRVFRAAIVGIDSLSDIAVLKIDVAEDLPVIRLGDSDRLKSGMIVIAIGSPFRLASSVSMGVVSGLARSVSGREMLFGDLIQTDAAINAGNSGGALIDLRGQLVGINTLIYTASGGNLGVGFAVPVNTLRWVAEDLIVRGKVVRGDLGLVVLDLDGAMRRALGTESGFKGVMIADVVGGLPAQRAGLRAGDLLISIDDRPILHAGQTRSMVTSLRPGSSATIEVLRDGKHQRFTARVEERSAADPVRYPWTNNEETAMYERRIENKSGLKVRPLGASMRRKYDIPGGTKGVVVVRVDPSFADGDCGLQEGDVIRALKIEGKPERPVGSVPDFMEVLSAAPREKAVLFVAERQGVTSWLALIVGGK
jgi:serine protease Do